MFAGRLGAMGISSDHILAKRIVENISARGVELDSGGAIEIEEFSTSPVVQGRCPKNDTLL